MNRESTTKNKEPKTNRFKIADLRGFKQMWPYIRPHKFGFDIGKILILTLIHL